MQRLLLLLIVLVASVHPVRSQLYEWTWINGSTSQNVYGVYGTKGVPSVSNQPGCRWGGVTWRDNAGNLWLFGGYGYGANSFGTLNDLWRYNISSNQWTWMSGGTVASLTPLYGNYGALGVAAAANQPGGRYEGLGWADNAGNLWLFGGFGGASTGAFEGVMNDVWKYNIATGLWTWVKGSNIIQPAPVYGTKGVAAANNNPAGRYRGGGWLDPAGKFWAFGGITYSSGNNSGYGNDMWRYDPVANTWTWMNGDTTVDVPAVYGTRGVANAANHPGGREETMSTTDASGDLWLFGGLGYIATGTLSLQNDLWKYNTTTNQWTWMKGDNVPSPQAVYGSMGLASPANKPGGRHSAAFWGDFSGNLWMLGGRGDGATFGELNDFWMYNTATNNWTWTGGDAQAYNNGSFGTMGVSSPTNMPGCREKAMRWTDATGNLWMFGGGGYPPQISITNFKNDLWRFALPFICNIPSPTLNVVQPTCAVPTGSITITAPAGNGYTYSVDGNDYSNTNGSFPALSPNTYIVTARNFVGCISTPDTVVLQGVQKPDTPVFTINQPTCPQPFGTITINSPLLPGLSYSINGSDYSNTTGVFSNVPPGSYTVSVRNAAGCTSTSVPAQVKAIPQFALSLQVNPVVVNAGETVTLTLSGSTNFTVDYWAPQRLFTNQQAVQQTIVANRTDTVLVKASTDDGCTDTAMAIIQLIKGDYLYIPNTFTPNGDGRNDVFTVYGNNIANVQMQLFNQWGQLMTTLSGDRTNGWDGNAHGRAQPTGVYVYVIRITMQRGEVLLRKGTVNLIR